MQNGEYGFNTTADRGADTFHPFNDIASGTINFTRGQVAHVSTGKRPRYLSAFQSNSYPIWIIYNVDYDADNALYYRSYSNNRGEAPIDGSTGVITISDDGFSIGPTSGMADDGAFTYFCI